MISLLLLFSYLHSFIWKFENAAAIMNSSQFMTTLTKLLYTPPSPFCFSLCCNTSRGGLVQCEHTFYTHFLFVLSFFLFLFPCYQSFPPAVRFQGWRKQKISTFEFSESINKGVAYSAHVFLISLSVISFFQLHTVLAKRNPWGYNSNNIFRQEQTFFFVSKWSWLFFSLQHVLKRILL